MGEKGAVLTMIPLISSDAVLNLCVQVLENILLQKILACKWKPKLNPCILNTNSVALFHECGHFQHCFYVQTELADSYHPNATVWHLLLSS